jgi:hypothetical protein
MNQGNEADIVKREDKVDKPLLLDLLLNEDNKEEEEEQNSILIETTNICIGTPSWVISLIQGCNDLLMAGFQSNLPK